MKTDKNDKMELGEVIEHFLDVEGKMALTIDVKGGNVGVDFDGSVPFLLFNALTTALQNGYTLSQVKEILEMANTFAKYKGKK